MSRASTVAPKNIERLSPVKGKDLLRSKVALWRGDITRLEFDAIVNAANESLLGGGGVDGAIHAAAGKRLLKECRKLNGCKTGEAKITKGYKLPAKHVIHTVGPIGENQELLFNCYKNSLDIMLSENLRTVAFPCISTGIYGYPNDPAANVALRTASNWLKTNHKSVDLIVFCLFLPIDVQIYKELADKYFPPRSASESHQGIHEQASSSVDPLLKDETIGDNHDKGHSQGAEDRQAELSPVPTGSATINVESKEQEDVAQTSTIEETELTTEDSHQNEVSGKRTRRDEENGCRRAEDRPADLSPIPTGSTTMNVERKEQEDVALASTMEETKLITEDSHQNEVSGKRTRCDVENEKGDKDHRSTKHVLKPKK